MTFGNDYASAFGQKRDGGKIDTSRLSRFRARSPRNMNRKTAR